MNFNPKYSRCLGNKDGSRTHTLTLSNISKRLLEFKGVHMDEAQCLLNIGHQKQKYGRKNGSVYNNIAK